MFLLGRDEKKLDVTYPRGTWKASVAKRYASRARKRSSYQESSFIAIFLRTNLQGL